MRRTRPRHSESGATPAGLVKFHTQHKMILLAHSPRHASHLGKLVAGAGRGNLDELLDEYETEFMAALGTIASRGRHVNTLQHLMGFLKDALSAEEKEEMLRVFEEYRQGWTPLVTPLTLLQHHLGKVKHEWADAQVYLEPYPRDLALRSAVECYVQRAVAQ